MDQNSALKKYFRGFLPVVIDLETSGSDCSRHGILEIAAVFPKWKSKWQSGQVYHEHVEMFDGAEQAEDSMKIHGIIPDHPFRGAIDEAAMMRSLVKSIKQQCEKFGTSKAILVAHNPNFDVGFLRAAESRTGIKLPMHQYTMFDTATMGILMYRETVLAKLCFKSGLGFDVSEAHGALYDAAMTAKLFWLMVNSSCKKISGG